MAKKTVLLVEDSATIRLAMKETLETVYDYEVIDFPDGATAVGALTARKTSLDAAILDMMMPGHGGSVKDYLRKTAEYKDMPIVYHTKLTKEQVDNRILDGAHLVQKGSHSIDQVAKILENLLR